MPSSLTNKLSGRSVALADIRGAQSRQFAALAGACWAVAALAGWDAGVTSTARSADAVERHTGWRLVGPPLVGIVDAQPPTSDQVAVAFRLSRSAGLTGAGNARASVSVNGVRAEWVSRVGPKRRHCYSAAPVTVPRVATLEAGATVRLVIAVRGRTVLDRRLSLAGAPEMERARFRTPGCQGRKER